MKYLIIILSILLTACSTGLNKEIDKEYAQRLINHHQSSGQIDSTLLEKSNSQKVEHNNYSNYLFIINSFNGDFNGWVYTQDSTQKPKEIRFLNFYYIKTIIKKEGKWSQVTGGW